MKAPFYHNCLSFISCAALVFAFAAPSNVNAATLSGSVISSSKISKKQEAQIDKFITSEVGKISKNNTSSKVEAARDQLLAPLSSKSATKEFLQTYSQKLFAPLAKKLSGDNSIDVRLNAIIIISHLSLDSSKILPQAIKALSDKNSALRYWGAKIISELANSKSTSLSAAQKSEIKKVLKERVSSESSAPVLGAVLGAMAATGGAQGRAAVLKALDSRIKYHQKHIHASYLAAQTAQRQIYKNLVSEAINNVDVSGSLKSLSGVTVQYYALVSEQLQKNGKKLTEEQLNDRLAMINMADHILRYALTKKSEDIKAPASIQNTVKNKDWDTLSKIAKAWKGIFN